MDKYRSYDELRGREILGVDYDIDEIVRDGARIAVIAPHGGAIEPATAEIAKKIAGEDFSYYAFVGKKATNNRHLHITSHRFDEPRGVNLVKSHEWIVALHGCAGKEERVLLGGRDRELIHDIETELAGVGIRAESAGHDFPGEEPGNICNRGSRGAGVQIELTMPFRQSKRLEQFIGAVRRVLAGRNGT